MNLFENDYYEIFYRFTLWLLLGWFLAKMSGAGTDSIPNKISTLISNPSTSELTQIYGVIGISVCGLALMIYTITRHLNISESTFAITLNALIRRIGSDLTLVPFSIMSFMLGVIINYFIIGTFTNEQEMKLLSLIPFVLLLMATIALVTLVSKPHDSNFFSSRFNNYSYSLRYSSSVALTLVPAVVIFIHLIPNK